jgi:selenocysteine lyase/cysteine desulfurase
MNIDTVRALFPGLQHTTYLNTAALAIGCTPARQAYERAVDEWTNARFDWTESERAGERARGMFARLIGAHADEVALVPSVSTAAGTIAANLPPAQRGENIVVADREFSSNYFPWLLLRERGYDVRTVALTEDGVRPDAYAAVADGGTRLIAVAAVQSATGFRADVPAISKIAARSGAWLFVDACQAAGAVPIDVVRDGVDFLATSNHKFLLGARGMGYLFVRRALLERLRPVVPGWKAARHPFESFYGPAMDLSPTASKLDASLIWFAALAEQASLALFDHFGHDAIVQRNAQLSRCLYDGLRAHDSKVPDLPDSRRSTIVSVAVRDPDAAMARLRAAGIAVSLRAGRLRLSVHFYNTEEEIDRAVEVLCA